MNKISKHDAANCAGGNSHFLTLVTYSIKRNFQPYSWALGMEAEMAEYLKELGNDA